MTKSREMPRVTRQQIADMIRLHRQGWSISAIAKSVGCHRQTVRAHLTERQADVLAEEVRKQALTDDLQKHLNDLIEFAAFLRGHLTIPEVATDDRDITEVLDPLLPKDFPQGLDSASQKARREQRQMERQNKMLFESLRQHTSGKGWWQAFGEWQQAWATCIKGLGEVKKQVPKMVEDLLNQQKANLKEEVEKVTGKKDVLERIVDAVIWVAWQVATASKPEEELKPREFRVLSEEQLFKIVSGNYYPNLTFKKEAIEAALVQEVATVCNHAFQNLYPRYMVDEILGMLHRMDEKIEEIDDALDPFVLRSLLVRTRCELCPV
ncbi:hypothetical protein ES703_61420 [subsurface metagenome]